MSNRLYPAYPQSAYLGSAGSTQSAFSLTAGRKAIASSGGGIFVSGSTVHKVVPLNGARGAAFQFFGTDANDETFDVRLWGATFGFAAGKSYPGNGWDEASFVDLNYLGSASVTLSTATGVSSSDLVPSTSFIADTITWTIASASTSPDGIMDDVDGLYGLGEVGAYSPAANVPATLVVPNFPQLVHGFLIEFDLTGAASGNALYTLTP